MVEPEAPDSFRQERTKTALNTDQFFLRECQEQDETLPHIHTGCSEKAEAQLDPTPTQGIHSTTRTKSLTSQFSLRIEGQKGYITLTLTFPELWPLNSPGHMNKGIKSTNASRPQNKMTVLEKCTLART